METGPTLSDLHEARTAAGLSMETLANQLGVTRQAVSQWEKGTTTPTGPARRLLSHILGLPLDTIDAWFAREEKAA